MKLTYFCNTMFLLEGSKTKVLCDPWVTTGFKSSSGLYNLPKLKTTHKKLASYKPDFIYISHTHPDHFDPFTLSHFPKDTPVLVSWYKHNFTEKAVKKLGFTDVRVCERYKSLKLKGNDKCWIEPSEKYSQVDSMAVFEIDNVKVFNANDCGFHEKQCKSIIKRFKTIDAACIPSGMQGPYPAFYENLNIKEKKIEAEKRKINNFQSVLNYLKILAPKAFLPFTGGAAYIGNKALLMKYCGVGTAKELKSYVSKNNIDTKTILLSENCSYDFSKKKIFGKFINHTFKNMEPYFKEISKLQSPFEKGGSFWIHPSQRIDLTNLISVARGKQKVWQERYKINSKLVFFIDIGQKYLYRMSLDNTEVARIEEKKISDNNYEIFRIPYSLFVGFLTRHYNYSNLKTQFVSFYRKPNNFFPELHILMSHLHL